MLNGKSIAKNKKAYFDYEVEEKYETGIILTGAEVKSVKAGHVQLKGSYATVVDSKVIVENLHISHYKCSNEVLDPVRLRELLLRKKEIAHLAGLSQQKGYTLILLEIFLKKGLVKGILGVCRGKKQHDKRLVLKDRAVNREINQGLKKFTR